MRVLALEGGACLTLQNHAGYTPLHTGLHLPACVVLEKEVQKFRQFEDVSREDVVRELLALGAANDKRDKRGQSPMELTKACLPKLVPALRQALRRPLIELCIGLRDLDLPVNVMLAIYERMGAFEWSLLYTQWEVAKLVKHC